EYLVRRRRSGCCSRRVWYHDAEFGTTPVWAFANLDRAARRRDEVLANGEAKSGARTRCVRREEWNEHACAVAPAHARPAARDRELRRDATGGGRGRNGDSSTIGHRLCCVLQQVDEHLLEAVRVDRDGSARRDIGDESCARLLELW